MSASASAPRPGPPILHVPITARERFERLRAQRNSELAAPQLDARLSPDIHVAVDWDDASFLPFHRVGVPESTRRRIVDALAEDADNRALLLDLWADALIGPGRALLEAPHFYVVDEHEVIAGPEIIARGTWRCRQVQAKGYLRG